MWGGQYVTRNISVQSSKNVQNRRPCDYARRVRRAGPEEIIFKLVLKKLLEGGEETHEEGGICKGEDHKRNISSRNAKKLSGCEEGGENKEWVQV